MTLATSKETFMVIYEPAVLWMESCTVHGVLVLERGGRKTIWLAKTFLVGSRTEALLLQTRDWNGASHMEMWRNETHAKHFTLESTHVKWTSGQFYSWWLG
jgi:hypothetical protein